jgi:hypothetical protein
MRQEKKYAGIDRREFLGIGLVGTTSVLFGWEGLAGAMQLATSESFVFPAPVYRTLGRTGLKITIVSFGAMLTPESEVMEIAFDHGVNYVDTARRYMGGKNEETVGRALKGKRDKVYVATKIAPASRSKEAMFKDVETSLRALGTDYVDIIQLHNVTGRDDRIFNPEIREVLTTLKKQGKVRFFGVTSHTNEAEVLNALVDDKDRFFDTALVKYNFKSSQETKEAIARAARANTGRRLHNGQAGPFQPPSGRPQMGPSGQACHGCHSRHAEYHRAPGRHCRHGDALRRPRSTDPETLWHSRSALLLPPLRSMRANLPQGRGHQHHQPLSDVCRGLQEPCSCQVHLPRDPFVRVRLRLPGLFGLCGKMHQRARYSRKNEAGQKITGLKKPCTVIIDE